VKGNLLTSILQLVALYLIGIGANFIDCLNSLELTLDPRHARFMGFALLNATTHGRLDVRN